MEKTKIEWCDSTWNPVTGCLHGCEYCYARRIALRFSPDANALRSAAHYVGIGKDGLYDIADPWSYGGRTLAYPFGFEPTLHHYRLEEPARKTKPRNIFVGSMTDLFGDWVPTEWIVEVFEACLAAPQHQYLFLTKNPQRYNDLLAAGLLPEDDNFWYGGTRTGVDSDREHEASMSGHTFLSIEPIHGPLRAGTLNALEFWDWVIIGAETGNRREKVVPEREWIAQIVDCCRVADVPVFMKDNLKDIWGEDPLREFPMHMIKNI